jgi:hypothetical protein
MVAEEGFVNCYNLILLLKSKKVKSKLEQESQFKTQMQIFHSTVS